MASDIIVVSGAIANKPCNGGATWTRLNYLLGLQKLGFDTYFIEQIEPQACVNQDGAASTFAECINVKYFRQVTRQFGLHGRMALVDSTTLQTEGASYQDLLDIADSSVFLVNISGHL